MKAANKENLMILLLLSVVVLGGGTVIYAIGLAIFHSMEIDNMMALTIFGSVCVICATTIYLIQAEKSGRNRVSDAEARKKVERIMRADRVVEHK